MRAPEIEVHLSDLHKSVFISHFHINKWQFKFNDKVFCCCCSVAKPFLSLCDPVDCTTTGFPVLHYLLEFVQTRVHWVSDAIQPSVAPFSPCHQSSPASGSVPVSWLLASGGQSIRASALASVLPVNIQDWFPLGRTWLDLLAVQRTLRSLLQHHSSKTSVPQLSAFFIFQLSHPYMTTGKTIAFTRWTFVGNVISLLFNMRLSWS